VVVVNTVCPWVVSVVCRPGGGVMVSAVVLIFTPLPAFESVFGVCHSSKVTRLVVFVVVAVDPALVVVVLVVSWS